MSHSPSGQRLVGSVAASLQYLLVFSSNAGGACQRIRAEYSATPPATGLFLALPFLIQLDQNLSHCERRLALLVDYGWPFVSETRP